MPTYTATDNLNDLVETNPPPTGYVNTDLGPAELETRRTFKAVILKEHNADGTHASVNGDVLVDGSVPASALANASLTATQYAAGSVGTAALAALAVTGANIALATITGAQIAAKTVGVGNMLSSAAGKLWVSQAGGGFAEVALSGGATMDATGAVTINTPASQQAIALFAEIETSGSDGGTFTSGAWQTRILNSSIIDSASLFNLSANRLTWSEPGLYYIRAEAPAYKVDAHQLRLWDPVNNVILADGQPAIAAAAASMMTNSSVEAVIEVVTGTPQAMIVQHRCATTEASDGLGKNAAFGDNSVFTRVTIIKLS